MLRRRWRSYMITSSVLTARRGLAIYDKAFIAYNDARQHLRDEIASAPRAKVDPNPPGD